MFFFAAFFVNKWVQKHFDLFNCGFLGSNGIIRDNRTQANKGNGTKSFYKDMAFIL